MGLLPGFGAFRGLECLYGRELTRSRAWSVHFAPAGEEGPPELRADLPVRLFGFMHHGIEMNDPAQPVPLLIPLRRDGS